MSDTFDDMFASSDDEQTTSTEKTQPTATTMDDLFGDDGDDDDDDGYDTHKTLQQQHSQTDEPRMQEDAEDITSKASLETYTKSLIDGAIGRPEHFYIKQNTVQEGDYSKEFLLLSFPRVIGADLHAYDPDTFDYRAAMAALPPFQREYTQGIESIMRYKIVTDAVTGEEKKVSNSRLIEWSNGKRHLQIGRQYFPLAVKQKKISKEKSTDYLFLHANGLFFYVGNIVTALRASIAPSQLSQHGHRMQAVVSRLAELDHERKVGLTAFRQ